MFRITTNQWGFNAMHKNKLIQLLVISFLIIVVQGCHHLKPPPTACSEAEAAACIADERNTWFGFPMCRCEKDDIVIDNKI